MMVWLWVADKGGAREHVPVGVGVKDAESGSVGVLHVGDLELGQGQGVRRMVLG